MFQFYVVYVQDIVHNGLVSIFKHQPCRLKDRLPLNWERLLLKSTNYQKVSCANSK